MVTHIEEHDTRVRRHLRHFVAACSCGWSEETVSRFTGWLASRRHLERRDGQQVPESGRIRREQMS
jgi:hypothetical protein